MLYRILFNLIVSKVSKFCIKFPLIIKLFIVELTQYELTAVAPFEFFTWGN